MKSPRTVFAVLLAMAVGLPSWAGADEIVEVFRLSSQSVAGSAQAVYLIDALDNASERLSAGLPNSPEEAQKAAETRLQALTEEDKAYLQRASLGVVRAAEYKITKVPAIVFDQRAVVYGVPDVNRAREIYHGWTARKGGAQ